MNAKRFCQLLGLVSLFLFADGQPGYADKTSKLSPAERTKIVDRLVEEFHGKTWAALRQKFAMEAIEADPRIPQDQRVALATKLAQSITRDEMLAGAKVIWDKALTASELQSINNFLSTPLGKKLVDTRTEVRIAVTYATRAAISTHYQKATNLSPPAPAR